MLKMKSKKEEKEETERGEGEKQPIDTNAFWLLGGLIGAVVGVRLSFNLICSFTMREPDFCQSIVHICTILLMILISFGAASGVVVGNIFYFLNKLFSKKRKKRRK